MASEAIKIAVRRNRNMETRVIKVADFKYEAKSPPRPFGVIYLLR